MYFQRIFVCKSKYDILDRMFYETYNKFASNFTDVEASMCRLKDNFYSNCRIQCRCEPFCSNFSCFIFFIRGLVGVGWLEMVRVGLCKNSTFF